MPSKSREPPREPKGVSIDEREFRIRVAERCLAAGRTSDEEIAYELSLEGRPEITTRSVRNYRSAARARLRESDEEIRTARRKILIRDIHDREKSMLDLLLRPGEEVQPKWADVVNILKLRCEIEAAIVPGEDGGKGLVSGGDYDEEQIDKELRDELGDAAVDRMFARVKLPTKGA
jgi:hypothetical protein